MAPDPTQVSETTQPDTVEEVWTYLGMRHDGAGGVRFHWRDQEDKIRIFETVKGLWPASRYTLRVTHLPDDGVSVVPEPKYVGVIEDQTTRSLLMAEHRTHETTLAAWRLAKKEGPGMIDSLTIAQVRARLQKLPVTQRRALLAVVLDRLQWGKKE